MSLAILLFVTGCGDSKALTPTSSASDVTTFLRSHTDFTSIELTAVEGKAGSYAGACVHQELELDLTVTVTGTDIRWKAVTEPKETLKKDGSIIRTSSATMSGRRSL